PFLHLQTGSVAPQSDTSSEIERLNPTNVIALGGDAAVCEATLRAAANGRPTDRLSGANRAGTAAAIALHEFSGGATTVYLAKGDNSPDAVAGGILTDGPVLLRSEEH